MENTTNQDVMITPEETKDNAQQPSSQPVEVRVTAKAQNAILARFADQCGGIERASKVLGVCSSTFSNWLNFKTRLSAGGPGRGGMPRRKARKIVLRLERLTGRNIREIFTLTKEDMAILSKPRVSEHVVPREAFLAYAAHTSQRLEFTMPGENIDLPERLAKVLNTLSFREREIIKLRYGLGDGCSYTLEETAHIFRVTRERLRQIEAKAIRKLKHPSLSSQLVGFLD